MQLILFFKSFTLCWELTNSHWTKNCSSFLVRNIEKRLFWDLNLLKNGKSGIIKDVKSKNLSKLLLTFTAEAELSSVWCQRWNNRLDRIGHVSSYLSINLPGRKFLESYLPVNPHAVGRNCWSSYCSSYLIENIQDLISSTISST